MFVGCYNFCFQFIVVVNVVCYGGIVQCQQCINVVFQLVEEFIIQDYFVFDDFSQFGSEFVFWQSFQIVKINYYGNWLLEGVNYVFVERVVYCGFVVD